MNPWLYDILSSFSGIAYFVAMALAGLACQRIRRRGGDKVFAASAWSAWAYLLLTAIPYTAHMAVSYTGLMAYETYTTLYGIVLQVMNIATVFLLGFFLLFAVAVFRTAGRMRSPSTPAVEAESETAG